MNTFSFIGDMFHILAICLLLLKILKTRSCADISGKSQILFTLVFITRYMDLFTYFVSHYNAIMKVLYISSSLVTVCLIYFKFKSTYDSNHDTFRMEILVVPVCGLALMFNYDSNIIEVLWAFSIYLESVAIVPQLFMISKIGKAETIISYYLFALGFYRALYIFNWVYRYHFEGFYDVISAVGGVVQTFIYCAFFVLYIFKGLWIIKDWSAVCLYIVTDDSAPDDSIIDGSIKIQEIKPTSTGTQTLKPFMVDIPLVTVTTPVSSEKILTGNTL